MGFDKFYETWSEQLHQLVSHPSKAPKAAAASEEQTAQESDLVQKLMSHFTDYYRVKSLAAKQDILAILTAPWCTALERSLHWIGGWRPTTAFHLLYTESSILFESNIVSILRGLRTGDLGDLSPQQFSRVSELQCGTVQEENSITDELSRWQDRTTELVGMCIEIDKKMEGLVSIVEKADDLRLRTIKRVVDLLTPQQALEFLIAAAELQFGIRGWGLQHERRR
jgi:hypothetical protein